VTEINEAGDLKTLFSQRAMYYAEDHRVMDELVNTYNGGLPQEFDEFFHEEQHVHLVNTIRLAWDDLSALAGKVFQLYVRPDNDSDTAKRRAEKQEQIGYGYNDAGRLAGGIEMDFLMKILMWWLVGTANAVMMVLPDYERKTPFFTFRDPRTHLPPLGWTPHTQTPLDDSLFVYQMSVRELQARYPERASELGRKATRRTIPMGWNATTTAGAGDDEHYVWVGEYYHKKLWMTATLEDDVAVLVASENGDPGHPGVVPVMPMQAYNPDTAKGRSMFADQISIQAAMARMFSQKLDYFDRSLYPIIFTTPLAGKNIRIGPYAINEFAIEAGVPPKLETVAPANPIDADQTMQIAMGMARMLNRNPESFQGGGEADSAKAINALAQGPDRLIRSSLWPAAISALPTAYKVAAELDVKLWPNAKKRSRGSRKNERFAIDYRPMVDLKGREGDFEVEKGIAVGGYQGTLQLMQLVQAELLSEDTALEQMEDVPHAREEKRKIQNGRMEKLIWADLQAKAGQGMLQPGALKRIKDLVAGKDHDLFDAIAEVENAGQLLVPPPDPMAAMGGPPGAAPGGLEQIAPTLDAIRRG
jgi:hypothetical protein